jgi:hypothetical protein
MVYFIQGKVTQLVKIGRTSRNVQNRLNRFTSPDVLVCLKVTEEFTERALHKRFRASWSHGEWFKPDPELMEFIAQLPPSKYDGLTQYTASPWSSERWWKDGVYQGDSGKRSPLSKSARRSSVPIIPYEYFNGTRLRLLRESQAKTKTWLGRKVKAASSQVSRWEAGEAQPRLVMVNRLAQALRVPAQYFIERSSDEPRVMPET